MDAFEKFNQTQNFINSTQVCDTQIIKGIDDLMNWIVHEGIPGACGRIKDWCGDTFSKGVNYASASIDGLSNNANGCSVTPTLARSLQVEGPAQSPEISQSVVASARESVRGMDQVQFNPQHIDSYAEISAPHTPNALSFGGQSISMMA